MPSKNSSQGDCNLKKMKRDTSNRYESKDNVIPSFEQLSKEKLATMLMQFFVIL